MTDTATRAHLDRAALMPTPPADPPLVVVQHAPAVGRATPTPSGTLVCGRPPEWPHLPTCYTQTQDSRRYVGRHRDPDGKRARRSGRGDHRAADR